jgi:hypothetical protein
LSKQSTYVHGVSPGGVTSLSLIDGVRLLEPPPYGINGKATVDATIKNIGSAPVVLDRIQAVGSFKTSFGDTYERDWPAVDFQPPLSLPPGALYRYTQLLAENFPGLATTATVMIYVKFNNIPGQQPITNFQPPAVAQVGFEVGHALNITNGPSGNLNPITSGGVVNLSVTATDSLGHEPSYAWTAECPSLGSRGSFSSTTSRTPTWAAPINTTGGQQNCTIQVIVSDGQGLTQVGSYLQGVNSDVINKPDLTVTAFDSPASAGIGDFITLSATVKNQGTARAPLSYVGFYLSSDSTISTADRFIGECIISVLDPGASSPCNLIAVQLPNVPPSTYYLGAIVDYNDQIVTGCVQMWGNGRFDNAGGAR